jgi:pimeloyl-ACP methyl ester carboxylesterase
MPRARAGNIEIEYVRHGDAAAPAFLLLMGATEQLVMWPDALIDALAGAGFQVVTFDYRDVGLSTKFDASGPVDIPKLAGDLIAGQPVSVPYTLSDMARDAVAVLDDSGIAVAHVAGLSLGGMIAQVMAIEHPSRVLSLTSIASTTGDRDLPPPTPGAVMTMFAVPPGSADQAWIDARVAAMRAMQGTAYVATEVEMRAAAEASVKRNLSPAGGTRHIAASIVTPPRGELLKAFQRPAQAIHGTDDQVMSPLCGKRTAESLPKGRLIMVEGMGHGLSRTLMPVWAEHLIALAGTATA